MVFAVRANGEVCSKSRDCAMRLTVTTMEQENLKWRETTMSKEKSSADLVRTVSCRYGRGTLTSPGVPKAAVLVWLLVEIIDHHR
jgi:hypothetical protein